MEDMKVFGETKENKNDNTGYAFGIDLGTTNSAISILKKGTIPQIIRLKGNASTMPSCVMWNGTTGEFTVGREAYKHRYRDNTIYSIKRIMGSDKTVTFIDGDKTLIMKPEEVSAEILKAICKEASASYSNIKDVVITVPAYFNNKQIEATRKAGELAGLNVLSTFKEPTSASLIYNQDMGDDEERKVLVYDLGGGTFDVSLVRIANKQASSKIDEIYGFEHKGDTSSNTVLSVISTDGDSVLGGDDVDIELYNILVDKLHKMEGVNPQSIPSVEREKLILNLEDLKKGGVGTYVIPIKFKLDNPKGTEVDTKVLISPEDFYKATKIIYDKTKAIIDRVLQGVNKTSIHSIVLVGGSTKSPIIRELLRKDFPSVLLNDVFNADESVALGAAVQAKRLKTNDSEFQVFDVLPLAIGIIADGRVNKLIMKNQVIPYSASRIFTTVEDNTPEINIEVYQGNSSLKEECIYLGNIIFKELPKAKAGEIPVVVTLSVNAEGLLKCKVSVNGKQREIELTNLFAGDTQVKKIKDKRIIKWRNLAERLVCREELLALVDKFEQGKIEASEVVKFISENKFSKKIPDIERTDLDTTIPVREEEE